MRIFFLRDHRKFPVACVASELVPADAEHVKPIVVFAMSIHNPLDKYDRKLGRAKAVGRLKGHQIRGTVVYEARHVRTDVLTAIAADKSLPMRVREAASWQLAHPVSPRVRRAAKVSQACTQADTLILPGTA